MINRFVELEHFVGFDWATQKHAIVAVNGAGEIVLQLEFLDTGPGWEQLRQALMPLGKFAVAIETSRGPEVERLLAMQVTVYPVNPSSAKAYRTRKAPSGVKDDLLDAYSLGDALRTDGSQWKSLSPEDPQTQLLRLLCRDEMALIEQRTAFVHQLTAALREYYPAALEAFDDWTSPASWAFVERFPSAELLAKAGRRKWQNFLHSQRLYRPETAERRMEIFARADQFQSPAPAVREAKSLLASSLAGMLRTLQSRIKQYRQRIEKCFADHPDHDVFGSLPGTGKTLGPRLLGEIGSLRQQLDSAEGLQCLAGTAPVTKQTGKTRFVQIRWMCNKVLRHTVHLWADESRQKCAWADAYYRRKREEGKSHAQALRCLGQRWIKILWKMWQEHTPYDEGRHMMNMVRHGSFVIGRLPAIEVA